MMRWSTEEAGDLFMSVFDNLRSSFNVFMMIGDMVKLTFTTQKNVVQRKGTFVGGEKKLTQKEEWTVLVIPGALARRVLYILFYSSIGYMYTLICLHGNLWLFVDHILIVFV